MAWVAVACGGPQPAPTVEPEAALVAPPTLVPKSAQVPPTILQPTPVPTPTRTPAPSAQATATPTLTATPTTPAMVMDHGPTPTPTTAEMVMEHPPTPTPTPGAIAVKRSPTPTPGAIAAPEPAATATPTAPARVGPAPTVQEVATIEDYSASRFYPDRVVVIKDVPLKLHMTRLHREHVNRFTIRPFVDSRDFYPPGTVGVVELTPDQSGEFKMHNVGHGYEGDFIVVESADEARRQSAERGVQEFSLIHDVKGGRVTPSRVVVQRGIPVRIYNTPLKGEVRVSIEPFYKTEDVNVKWRAITTFEFTPDAPGEYPIRYDDQVVEGTLVVE